MPDKLQILVCTRGKKCCKKGGDAVYSAFETAVTELGCGDKVTVKGAKCLGLCKHGPGVVVMPEKVKYGEVAAADAKEIITAHVNGDKPVKRLRVKKKKK